MVLFLGAFAIAGSEHRNAGPLRCNFGSGQLEGWAVRLQVIVILVHLPASFHFPFGLLNDGRGNRLGLRRDNFREISLAQVILELPDARLGLLVILTLSLIPRVLYRLIRLRERSPPWVERASSVGLV